MENKEFNEFEKSSIENKVEILKENIEYIIKIFNENTINISKYINGTENNINQLYIRCEELEKMIFKLAEKEHK